MTPLEAAASISGMATARASLASVASLPASASRTRFMKVRNVEVTCLFLSFFFSFCLNLFRADLWFAKLHLRFMVINWLENFGKLFIYHLLPSIVKRQQRFQLN